jgi:subtilase family serine protease
VLPLESGVIYRMVVRFRWHDEEGNVIASTRRRSWRCSQGRSLPNLVVTERVAVSPGQTATTTRYRITVVNSGRARARAVEVALLVDGADVDSQPIGTLSPGERRRVWFVGPRCTASIEARVDPRGLVRESSEGDNARLTACPSGS